MVIGKYVFLACVVWLSAGVSSWAESSVLLDNDVARRGLRGPVNTVLTYQNINAHNANSAADNTLEDNIFNISSLAFDQQGRVVEYIVYAEPESPHMEASPRYVEQLKYEDASESGSIRLRRWDNEGVETVQEGTLLNQADLVVLSIADESGTLLTSVVTRYNGSHYDASTFYYDFDEQPWTDTPSSGKIVRTSITGLAKTTYSVGYETTFKLFYIDQLNKWGDSIKSISFFNYDDMQHHWYEFFTARLETFYRYEYDKHQNWIKQYDVKTGALFQYREIDYYE